MPTQSKWESLPTEAINPISLAVDKAAVPDIIDMPATAGRRDGQHYLNISRLLTAVFGAIQIAVAIVAISLSSRVVDEVLGIASFTNGVILGVFLLGTFSSVGQRSAFAGIVGGTGIMLAIKLLTAVHWQWYVLIGSIATFLIGALVARTLPREATTPSALRP